MLTREDVESYLLRTGLHHEEIGEGMWLAEASNGPGIVIHLSPPLLVFRMKVMDLPQDEPRCAALFRRLLELNATDLVHAAYALEEGDVILTESLEVENLDFNEFQATIDSFQMALASHLEALADFRDCAPAQA
ncbi:MAG TPA: YbjN domain-containing protein [Longimicrobium sp.]|nr:YbjN domain-containing protein [Longimicrobium sp.]